MTDPECNNPGETPSVVVSIFTEYKKQYAIDIDNWNMMMISVFVNLKARFSKTELKDADFLAMGIIVSKYFKVLTAMANLERTKDPKGPAVTQQKIMKKIEPLESPKTNLKAFLHASFVTTCDVLSTDIRETLDIAPKTNMFLWILRFLRVCDISKVKNMDLESWYNKMLFCDKIIAQYIAKHCVGNSDQAYLYRLKCFAMEHRIANLISLNILHLHLISMDTGRAMLTSSLDIANALIKPHNLNMTEFAGEFFEDWTSLGITLSLIALDMRHVYLQDYDYRISSNPNVQMLFEECRSYMASSIFFMIFVSSNDIPIVPERLSRFVLTVMHLKNQWAMTYPDRVLAEPMVLVNSAKDLRLSVDYINTMLV